MMSKGTESILFELTLTDEQTKHVNQKSFGEITEFIGVTKSKVQMDSYLKITETGIYVTQRNKTFLIPFCSILQVDVGHTVYEKMLPQITGRKTKTVSWMSQQEAIDEFSEEYFDQHHEELSDEEIQSKYPGLKQDMDHLSLYIHHVSEHHLRDHYDFYANVNQIVLPIGYRDWHRLCVMLSKYVYVNHHAIFATESLKQTMISFRETEGELLKSDRGDWFSGLIMFVAFGGFGLLVNYVMYQKSIGSGLITSLVLFFLLGFFLQSSVSAFKNKRTFLYRTQPKTVSEDFQKRVKQAESKIANQNGWLAFAAFAGFIGLVLVHQLTGLWFLLALACDAALFLSIPLLVVLRIKKQVQTFKNQKKEIDHE